MTEIRISGYGGQGIIRCGYIIGKATSLYDNKYATLTQSFGPEARGSACSAQVLVSEDKILYPYVTLPHILVAMSQEAYTKFSPNLDLNGILIIDDDLVTLQEARGNIKTYAIPSTRLAEEMGAKIVANIVMLGFFTAITGVITPEAAKKAVSDSVPQRLVDLNLRAFEKGFKFGQEVKEVSKVEKV
ncbi:MAG: 2-oxoacid:acceptor oxidoreductase family protein [candidate division Zixibacteria bacterium]|nr:2-oxoacid:acceptor oxidoreductase family protein [candidate division Zixibacteria bacterium]